MTRQQSFYQFMLMSGIVLLFLVLIEPAPSDLIFVALMPAGLLIGAVRLQLLPRFRLAILLLLAYFLCSLPGLVLAADLLAAIRYFLITCYLFLLALLFGFQEKSGHWTAWLRAYLLAAGLSFLAGLAGYLGLLPDLLMIYGIEMKGLFKDSNVFGPFFVPAVILLLDDWKPRRLIKGHRLWSAALIAALTLGIILSYSRAAYINLIVAGLVYLALRIWSARQMAIRWRPFCWARIRWILLSVAVILVVATLLALVPALRGAKILAFIQDRASLKDYDLDRFATQFGGLKMIIRHPLGVGAGQFENEITAITGQMIAAHSLYIRTAAESGILGFICFFSAITVIFLLLWRDMQAVQCEPAGNHWAAVLIAVLAGILVNSLVIDTLHWRHFWLLIGFALYYLQNRQPLEKAVAENG